MNESNAIEKLLNKKPDERFGLVLGGGGSKGCYHVGVWQALNELNVHFDAVTGTSIGALVGAFYPGNRIDEVTDFVMGMKPQEIAQDLLYMPKSFKETVAAVKPAVDFLMKYKESRMDITPLREHFRSMFDIGVFEHSPVQYACMSWNDTKKEAHPFFKGEITRESAEDIIMASAACYPAFPKVVIDGEEYMDGMYADNVPVSLLEQIAPRLDLEVVVDLHYPEDPVNKNIQDGMIYIQPIYNPGNPLDFSPDHARRLYAQGYLDTRRLLGLNPGHVFTFRKEDAGLIEVVDRYLEAQRMQLNFGLPEKENLGLQALNFTKYGLVRDFENPLMTDYENGRLIEALGILARLDPSRIYDFRSFLVETINRLQNQKLTDADDHEYRLVEIIRRLKREEIPALFHRILVMNHGRWPARLEKLKQHAPISFTLAAVWYFLEELVLQLEPPVNQPVQIEAQDVVEEEPSSSNEKSEPEAKSEIEPEPETASDPDSMLKPEPDESAAVQKETEAFFVPALPADAVNAAHSAKDESEPEADGNHFLPAIPADALKLK